MATSDSNSRKDIAWKYAYLADPNNKNDLTCNFCGQVAKGGAYRLKQHLAGGYTAIYSCQNCPEPVKEEVRQYMSKKKRKGKRQIHLTTDFDKSEENEVAEVIAPNKRVQNLATANDAYKKELREKACVDIARWLYEAGIPLNAVDYNSFKDAIQSIGQYGIGMKPPSYYEVRVPLLKKEVAHIDDIMKSHKEEWAKTGCSIMSNGWQDKSHQSLINFLVNCSKGSMFVESINASSYMNSEERMFQLLDSMVEKIGADNVIQVITDIDSSNERAGRLLEEKRPHLYWTPCAARCLDLILEDIAKLPTIMRTIKRAVELTGYIYNCTGLLNMMRHFTRQRNLLKLAKTRFATSFLTLSRIYKQKENLEKMFTSEDWTRSKWAKEQTGKRVAQTVLMSSFWNTIVYSLKVSGPLVRVLRLVDGEKKPAMGYIYKAIDQAKEAISFSFKEREDKYREIFEIIDRRWECQLRLPLHAAGYFLNPEYFYDNLSKIEQDEAVMNGLYKCIERLVPDIEKQDRISEELKLYKKEVGLFGRPMAIRDRKRDAPGNANNIGIWDGHSQHAITEAMHFESPVIYNDKPSAVFHSCYDSNPQMVYGQYSSVATPLPPSMVDRPLYSPQQDTISSPYYAQASAPNLPQMSSAIPVSSADVMVPENSSMDTMPFGQGSGGTGSGYGGGGSGSGYVVNGSFCYDSHYLSRPIGNYRSYKPPLYNCSRPARACIRTLDLHFHLKLKIMNDKY